MADNEEQKDKDPIEEPKEQAAQSGAKLSILTWIIMAVVIVVMAGSGFVLGRLVAGSSSPKTTDSPQEDPQTEAISLSGSDDTWYYNELESVVVNPDVPDATRFVRVGLILEMSSGLSKEEVTKLIDAEKPLLMNWLNLYFKSLTLEEMGNDSDLRRILSHVCDAFNEMLFGDAKPQIKRILIREFNIQ